MHGGLWRHGVHGNGSKSIIFIDGASAADEQSRTQNQRPEAESDGHDGRGSPVMRRLRRVDPVVIGRGCAPATSRTVPQTADTPCLALPRESLGPAPLCARFCAPPPFRAACCTRFFFATSFA